MQTDAERQLNASIENLDGLKPEMEGLKQLVNSYVSNLHESLVVKRAEYEKKLANLKATESKLLIDIQNMQASRQQLMDELSKEIADRDAASLNIKEMKLQQENLINQKNEFEAQLSNIRSQISRVLKEINEQRQKINSQSTIISDKLYQYEQLLGLKIETGGRVEGNKLIKFIFTNVDPEDFSREVWFVLNPEELEISETFPNLDPSVLDNAMSLFLKDKEIGQLWKTMRNALKLAIS